MTKWWQTNGGFSDRQRECEMAEIRVQSGRIHLTRNQRKPPTRRAQIGKLRLDFLSCDPLGVRMDKALQKTPDEIAATLVLAARFIMDDASARIALPSTPPRSLLVELARLVDDTAKQLEVLSIALDAALRQPEQ